MALAEEAEPALRTSAFRTWQRRIGQELPNLRAAFEDARAAGDADALRIANALWWFWGSTDRHREGRRWVEEALGAEDADLPVALRVRALSALGYLATSQMWFESFQNWQSEFLSIAAVVVLSIFLRQRGSPESKPVSAPHSETGSS